MTLRLSHSALRNTLSGIFALGILALTSGASYGEVYYPAEVATLKFGHGARLTNTEGMTLYQFENDLRVPGESNCVDECAVKHPPLLAVDIPFQIPDNWGLIERNDGAQQWVYKGMPLYSYIKDSHVGADYGQGRGWNVAFVTITTPPEMSVASTVLGHVLAASSNGQTLYVHNGEITANNVACADECLETWTPVKAPWSATGNGDFSVHVRPDGVYQWAYEGKPLYSFSGDSEKGDLNGNGVDGLWSAMLLEAAPPVPDWVSVVGSDGGLLYANSEGMTLYTFYEDENARDDTYRNGLQCDEACLGKYWAAASASSKVEPIGYWSVIERDDAGLQWAYMGHPLYTHNFETRPGELLSTSLQQFRWMAPIMYALPALRGVLF